MNTYESTLEEGNKIEKVSKYCSYILNNWSRIIDWIESVDHPPENARSLSAMESNQRRITYRMKKRRMYWSSEGAETIVKIKQGIFNSTLKAAYLNQMKMSTRKQREVKKRIRMSSYLRQPTRPSIGVKEGSIPVYGPRSSTIGKLAKNFR